LTRSAPPLRRHAPQTPRHVGRAAKSFRGSTPTQRQGAAEEGGRPSLRSASLAQPGQPSQPAAANFDAPMRGTALPARRARLEELTDGRRKRGQERGAGDGPRTGELRKGRGTPQHSHAARAERSSLPVGTDPRRDPPTSRNESTDVASRGGNASGKRPPSAAARDDRRVPLSVTPKVARPRFRRAPGRAEAPSRAAATAYCRTGGRACYRTGGRSRRGATRPWRGAERAESPSPRFQRPSYNMGWRGKTSKYESPTLRKSRWVSESLKGPISKTRPHRPRHPSFRLDLARRPLSRLQRPVYQRVSTTLPSRSLAFLAALVGAPSVAKELVGAPSVAKELAGLSRCARRPSSMRSASSVPPVEPDRSVLQNAARLSR
jgi:hypothetical protein